MNEASAGPFAVTSKRTACVPVCDGALVCVACGSPVANAAPPLTFAFTLRSPLAPATFVTETPALNVSPGRANCGRIGSVTSGFVAMNVASPLPKRASLVSASTITRQVVRSSGSGTSTVALPAASVRTDAFQYASGKNFVRTRVLAGPAIAPPPKPKPLSRVACSFASFTSP